MKKELIFKKVTDSINKCKHILSARIYGSWLHDANTIDLDIAVMIKSKDGIVDSSVYRYLRNFRSGLAKSTNCDIDLVPHTLDEVEDLNSPLWYPRYNPSLIFGENIKGIFPIQP